MGCDSPRPGRLVTLVRLGLAADLVELSVALAIAFLNDPMMVWIGGDRDDEARRAAMAPGFFLPALQAGIRRGHTYSTADLSGAAIWSPPDTKIFDDIGGAMFGEAMSRHLGAETTPTACPRTSSRRTRAMSGSTSGTGSRCSGRNVRTTMAHCYGACGATPSAETSVAGMVTTSSIQRG